MRGVFILSSENQEHRATDNFPLQGMKPRFPDRTEFCSHRSRLSVGSYHLTTIALAIIGTPMRYGFVAIGATLKVN